MKKIIIIGSASHLDTMREIQKRFKDQQFEVVVKMEGKMEDHFGCQLSGNLNSEKKEYKGNCSPTPIVANIGCPTHFEPAWDIPFVIPEIFHPVQLPIQDARIYLADILEKEEEKQRGIIIVGDKPLKCSETLSLKRLISYKKYENDFPKSKSKYHD